MSQAESPQTYSPAYVRYAMGVVLLVAMFNVIDRTIVSMLVPGIKADLGLDDAQIGILMGPAFAAVHFLAVLPAAWLADRTSRRTVIAAAKRGLPLINHPAAFTILAEAQGDGQRHPGLRVTQLVAQNLWTLEAQQMPQAATRRPITAQTDNCE